jgi:hypothetical protein
MARAYENWGKHLVDIKPDTREPSPSVMLKALLRSIAEYIVSIKHAVMMRYRYANDISQIHVMQPKDTYVVTIGKLVDFYAQFAVQQEPVDWTSLYQPSIRISQDRLTVWQHFSMAEVPKRCRICFST